MGAYLDIQQICGRKPINQDQQHYYMLGYKTKENIL